MNAPRSAASAFFASPVVWAIYLACSWTWCIGMYLPLVLRDHYGWGGVVAFAIPNVAGVVLFGAVISTAGMSRALIARHHGVMAWFSLITIAFHVYFLAAVWGYEFAGASWAASLLVPLPVAALAWLARQCSDRTLRLAAVFVYAASLGLMVITLVLRAAGDDEGAQRAASWAPRQPAGLIFLAPLFILGFLTCPCMDLTFHRALQGVGGGRRGRITFALFGAFFTAMIGYTAIYSVTGLLWPVVLHMLVQSWFTMTLHWREIEARRGDESATSAHRWLWPVLALSWAAAPLPVVDYRWWFIFTGLVFPAWVVLTMARARLGRRAAPEWTIAAMILLLAPFAAAGFLGGFEWLLLVPCAVLTISLLAGRPAGAGAAGAPADRSIGAAAPTG